MYRLVRTCNGYRLVCLNGHLQHACGLRSRASTSRLATQLNVVHSRKSQFYLAASHSKYMKNTNNQNSQLSGLLDNRCGKASLLGVTPSARQFKSCSIVESKRFISTTTQADLAQLGLKMSDIGTIPPIPSVPLPGDSSLMDIVGPLTRGTVQELGLGCSYTPVGWLQTTLDMLHTTLDIPWWGVIVLTTVSLRLVTVYIDILIQRRNSNMHNHNPELIRRQERMHEATRAGDTIERMEAHYEYADYMKRHDLSPLTTMKTMLPRMFVFSSMFFGVRKMAEYKVTGFETEGVWWRPDLTQADSLLDTTMPLFLFDLNVPGILPFMMAATLYASIKMGVEIPTQTGQTQTMMKLLRVGPPVMAYLFGGQFASAMCVYWLTSNVMSMGYGIAFRQPYIRKLCAIPERRQHTAMDKALLKIGTKYMAPQKGRDEQDVELENQRLFNAAAQKPTERASTPFTRRRR